MAQEEIVSRETPLHEGFHCIGEFISLLVKKDIPAVGKRLAAKPL